jgi:8-oxo-dGTP diphosphatase
VRTVIVAAGILIEDGKVLLSRRKQGTHLAGLWEFPGGKTEAGEDPRAALMRELEEELGITTRIGEIVDVTFHRYEEADKAVLLLFFEAEREQGSPDPRALDVAEVAWPRSPRPVHLSPCRCPSRAWRAISSVSSERRSRRSTRSRVSSVKVATASSMRLVISSWVGPSR